MTSIEFLKLEKIELGGVRGNILGCLVVQIYEEFVELIKVFAECKYDPLDPADEVSLFHYRKRIHMYIVKLFCLLHRKIWMYKHYNTN